MRKTHAANPCDPWRFQANNRPDSVHCIHPMVTLIEKLDAISKRFERGVEAPGFVRHYEDAAHIIQAAQNLPVLVDHEGSTHLIREMLAEKQIRWAPRADDPAFRPLDIEGMFWGPRLSLAEATELIRAWIESLEA
jgi:hypothetical protein